MQEGPMKGGDEYDMLTRWRKVMHHDRGRSKAAKRKYIRRQRRNAKGAQHGD